MGARYDKKTRERAKLEKKALFFVEINRQYCEHLPDNERGYMSMYGPADDAKAAQVSRLLLRLSGVSEEAIDSAYPVAELRGMERGGEGQWIEIKEGSVWPEYGVDVLLWMPSLAPFWTSERAVMGWLSAARWNQYGVDAETFPTHWMPLPTAPVATLSVTEGVDGWIDCKQELPRDQEKVLAWDSEWQTWDRVIYNDPAAEHETPQWEVSKREPFDSVTHWQRIVPPQSGVDGREK